MDYAVGSRRRTAPSPGARATRSSAASFLFVAAVACAGTGGASDGVSCVQFSDLVVPSGFELQDDGHQSHSHQEGDWRVGRFVYFGSNRMEEAAGYVRQRMPQHGWEIQADESQHDNKVRLRYVRGPYSSEYLFLRQDGFTQLTVDYKTDFSRR